MNLNMFIVLFIYSLGVSGCLPPRLRDEEVWNSTANLVKKPEDLVN